MFLWRLHEPKTANEVATVATVTTRQDVDAVPELFDSSPVQNDQAFDSELAETRTRPPVLNASAAKRGGGIMPTTTWMG